MSKRIYNYECILKSRATEVHQGIEYRVLYSVNKFRSITQVCKWLEDVNLDVCECEIIGLNTGRSFDPYELLEVWNA